ncbi:hypothetical protein ABZ990_11705 [Streptomyces sp. NPDC046203]|uniref:hypothetical protein n=1 Tax=Streptomyces sp. NPDC046203 TaxID=3154602 RepID=UPI0034032333
MLLSWIGSHVVRGAGAPSSGSAPAATHRLALPPTLLGGHYTLADDLSEQANSGIANADESNIQDPKGVVAQYTATGKTDTGVLVVSGLYGRISDPALARDKMLKGGGEANGVTVVVPPENFTPAGADTEVSCQILSRTQSGGGSPIVFPVCVWADDNTSASVSEVTARSAGQDPFTVDLEKAARTTLKIRDEMRRPLS